MASRAWHGVGMVAAAMAIGARSLEPRVELERNQGGATLQITWMIW